MKPALFALQIPLAILLCLPGKTFAAPQVSGVSGQLQHGATVTISGQGFGTKAGGAAPYRWDNFESGTVPNPLAAPWDMNYSGEGPIVPIQYGFKSRTGVSQKVANVNFDNQGRSDFGKNASTPPTDIYQLYLSFYAYIDFRGTLSRNFKIFRSYSAAGDDHDMIVLTTYPKADFSWQYFFPPFGSASYTGVSPGEDRWHKYEFWTNLLSDHSESKLWIDGRLVVNQTSTAPETSGRGMDELRIGHYLAHDDLVCSDPASARYGQACYPDNDNDSFCGGPCHWSYAACNASGGCHGTISFDDVYIDQTPARVELCSKSTYAAKESQGDVCEIQIPSAWSATGITVGFNRGAFSGGQTAYVYVTDPSGAVNAQGYSVVISGQAGDGVAPGQPQNLLVN